MKILIIGKYPPIEGGVAAHTYWLAKSLGARGHTVSVVTNAERVESQYREVFDKKSIRARGEYEPQNVRVYSFSDEMPVHVPYSEGYVTRLVNTALEVIEKNGADVIYVHYLEPYGTAALLLNKLTGIPYVIRHAGSDIYRLLKSPDLSLVLGRVLQQANMAMLTAPLHVMARAIGISKRRLLPLPHGATPSEFVQSGTSRNLNKTSHTQNVPVIGYLGKATQNKGLEEILEVCAKNRPNLCLALFTNGPLLESLKDIVHRDEWLSQHVTFLPFVPPWEIPEILRSLDGLLHLENKFPIPIHSPQQPYEAMLCGTPLIVSEEMKKKLEFTVPTIGEYVTTVIDPTDKNTLGTALTEFAHTITERKKQAQELISLVPNGWDAHVGEYEKALSVVRGKGMLRYLALRIAKYF